MVYHRKAPQEYSGRGDKVGGGSVDASREGAAMTATGGRSGGTAGGGDASITGV